MPGILGPRYQPYAVVRGRVNTVGLAGEIFPAGSPVPPQGLCVAYRLSLVHLRVITVYGSNGLKLAG